MWCTFASKSKVIDIIDSAVLKGIKARLRSGDGLVTLEFADEEDKSKEGSEINKGNNSENKDN